MKPANLPAPLGGVTGWPWVAGAAEATPAGEDLPRITVVTPSYNQGQYLEATLRSVLLQGYPNLEYIVIDGGSRDESVSVLQRYHEHLDYWVSEPDRGQSHAIMKGFGRATGTVLAWLNSDDLYLPGALHTAARALRAHPGAPFVYGDARHVEPDGQVMTDRPRAQAYDRAWMLEHSNLVPQPAAFIRAGAYHAAGGLDERFHYMMDWDLWLRLDALGQPAFVPEVLAHMRLYPSAKFQRPDRALFVEFLTMAAKHGRAGLPLALRQRMLATQLDLAMAAYQRGDDSQAADELDFALDHLPAGQVAERLPQAIAACAWNQHLQARTAPLATATRILDHLPERLRPAAALRGRTLGLLHEALAFAAAQRGQRLGVWRAAWQAMRTDRRQAANRGLWSLAARAVLGGLARHEAGTEQERAG